MKKNKRLYIAPPVPPTANNNGNNSNSNSTFANFEYKPPNNIGNIIGIFGDVLVTVGDALGTIGAIIQLDIDVSADLQSQVDDFKSNQEKDKMREEIDDLKEQVKEIDDLKEQVKLLVKIIKSNQN
ncbi:hypothetical protein J2Y03_005820 [Neobacillus niacini]|uniref:hypothetical protein n=1 Tax=Neobacillus niacini TaxID=86668 RepID=UPI002862A863|nr:hypothetical protein [Neobacillus niacini]MDR7080722.1 hypothetical protein [Neobacillus niacini]